MGITNSLAIHKLCGETGTGCWLGGMGESSLGTTVVANLCTLPYVNYPSDISPADKFYVETSNSRSCSPISPAPTHCATSPDWMWNPIPPCWRNTSRRNIPHEKRCRTAWVDGYVSLVPNINKKAPYNSDPFRNGDKVGDISNHWNLD